MRRTVIGCAAALAVSVVLATAPAALAQDMTGFVKARQGFMDQQQKDVNAIAAYGKGEGDQATALQRIKELIAMAPKITGYFENDPETSSTAMPKVSSARPEIWQSFDKFKAIIPMLQAQENKLRAAIESGDPHATMTALASMYRNGCGACHTDYRAPKS
jgi:cytochrome c556